MVQANVVCERRLYWVIESDGDSTSHLKQVLKAYNGFPSSLGYGREDSCNQAAMFSMPNKTL